MLKTENNHEEHSVTKLILNPERIQTRGLALDKHLNVLATTILAVNQADWSI